MVEVVEARARVKVEVEVVARDGRRFFVVCFVLLCVVDVVMCFMFLLCVDMSFGWDVVILMFCKCLGFVLSFDAARATDATDATDAMDCDVFVFDFVCCFIYDDWEGEDFVGVV